METEIALQSVRYIYNLYIKNYNKATGINVSPEHLMNTFSQITSLIILSSLYSLNNNNEIDFDSDYLFKAISEISVKLDELIDWSINYTNLILILLHTSLTYVIIK